MSLKEVLFSGGDYCLDGRAPPVNTASVPVRTEFFACTEGLSAPLIGRVQQQVPHWRNSFLLAIQAALQSEDPLKVMYGPFKQVKERYSTDIRVEPFLHAMDALFTRCRVPESASLLFSILYGVFSGQMTPLQGHEVSGQLLFLIDQGIWPEDVEAVSREARASLLEKYKGYQRTISAHEKGDLYDSDDLEQVLLPQTVASVLILRDGVFNSGIIPLMKEIFLSNKDMRTPIECRIVQVLRQIQADRQLQQLFAGIRAPLQGSFGEVVVNAITFRSSDTICSVQDTSTAILGSCLTWHRQKEVGNCFIVSWHLEIREGRVYEYVKDCIDLISKGYLIRWNGDAKKEIHLFSLEAVVPRALHKKIVVEEIGSLFQIPAVQHGCASLCCKTVTDFLEICSSIGEKELSLNDILSAIATRYTAPSEALRQAMFAIEAPGQALLLQLWENAATGVRAIVHNPLQEYLSLIGREYGKKYFHQEDVGTIVDGIVAEIAQHDESMKFLVAPSAAWPTMVAEIPYTVKNGRAVPFASLQTFFTQLTDLRVEVFHRLALNERFKLAEEIQSCDFDSPEVRKRGIAFLYEWQRGWSHGERSSMEKALLENSAEGLEISDLCALVQIPHTAIVVDRHQWIENFLPISIEINRPREWLLRFLEIAGELRARHGSDPFASAIADGYGHQYRFTFNDPTLLHVANGEELQVLECQLRIAAQKPRWNRKEALRIVQHIVETAPRGCLVGQPVLLQRDDDYFSFNDIIRHISSMAMSQEPFWRRYVAMIRSSFRPQAVEAIVLHATNILVEMAPDCAGQLFCVADMNWKATIGATRAALWFDPLRVEWRFVYTEEGKITSVVDEESVVEFFSHASLLDIDPVRIPVRVVCQEKNELMRRTIKKTQRIEIAFVRQWHAFTQQVRKGALADRARVIDEVSRPFADDQRISEERIPKECSSLLTMAQEQSLDWRQALDLCLRLQALYQSIMHSTLIAPAVQRVSLLGCVEPFCYLEDRERLIKSVIWLVTTAQPKTL